MTDNNEKVKSISSINTTIAFIFAIGTMIMFIFHSYASVPLAGLSVYFLINGMKKGELDE